MMVVFRSVETATSVSPNFTDCVSLFSAIDDVSGFVKHDFTQLLKHNRS